MAPIRRRQSRSYEVRAKASPSERLPEFSPPGNAIAIRTCTYRGAVRLQAVQAVQALAESYYRLQRGALQTLIVEA